MINFGGQVAGFVSPMVMGFLISAFNSSYDAAFWFLILSAFDFHYCLHDTRQCAKIAADESLWGGRSLMRVEERAEDNICCPFFIPLALFQFAKV
ncbi:hypothetical protein [Brevibacillus choshinensis]|uniref:hypothetical protein n=1 Tax=Brevibacillus choshinensis TaxID=54911 RepID=UPI002E25137F|nr:hypothetical protein [Brevibacillus choshinensis]